MSDPLKFSVAGDPTPQGSMRLKYNTRNGQPELAHANPELARWRKCVEFAARTAVGTAAPLDAYCPCAVRVTFRLSRPATGHGGRKLDLPHPSQHPDLDKLCRGLLDACTKILWQDDGQVTELTARKRYVEPGEVPGADVEVEAIEVAQRSLL